ncbi:MAG: sugar kinase [Bacteroidetes bacterium HGW-Bacteroidetes-13]|nr:MAG: sugar kinase [Bacteroidetes bacterium HGW-Bacteroidetes-13]
MNEIKNLIGVDLGATNVRSGAVVKDKLTKTYADKLPENKSKEGVLQSIYTAVEAVWNEQIDAIGIGVPSVVDRAKGVVYNVQNIPSWDEVPLKTLLEKRFGVPVYVNNDANCFALGELHFGKGKRYKHFVGLAIGTGIAGGIIQNGKLLIDVNCGSGEFGEMCYLDSKFEDYCSGIFFEKHHQTAAKTVFEKALKGDEKARQIVSEFAIHLGKLIKTIVCAIDPEAIIIGGSIAKSKAVYHPLLMNELQDFPYPRSIQKLKIDYTDTHEVQLLGSAYLPVDAGR